MANETFLIQIDTPSIKQYVFGTDPLNEVRGASARLDWLNRHEMERVLGDRIANVEKIYANGGAAQFVARECSEGAVRSACRKMVRYIREQTGGEVRVAYGIAPFQGEHVVSRGGAPGSFPIAMPSRVRVRPSKCVYPAEHHGVPVGLASAGSVPRQPGGGGYPDVVQSQ